MPRRSKPSGSRAGAKPKIYALLLFALAVVIAAALMLLAQKATPQLQMPKSSFSTTTTYANPTYNLSEQLLGTDGGVIISNNRAVTYVNFSDGFKSVTLLGENRMVPSSVAISPSGSTAYALSYNTTGSPIFNDSTYLLLSVINVSKGTVLKTIPITNNALPDKVLASPSGGFVYVMATQLDKVGTIYVVNTTTYETRVIDIPNAGFLYDALLSPNGQDLYLLNPYGNVAVFNVSSQSLVTLINISAPRAMALSPNGKYLYVASASYQNSLNGAITQAPGIFMVNTTTNIASSAISFPEGTTISQLASALNGDIYVDYSNANKNQVSVINPSSANIIANISYSSGYFASPSGMVASPSSSYVYLIDYGTNLMYAINTTKNAITGTTITGISPTSIILSPNGAYALVANQGSASVSIINTQDGKLYRNAVLGGGISPSVPVLSKRTGVLYVPNEDSYPGTISVINGTTGAMGREISLGYQTPSQTLISPDGKTIYSISTISPGTYGSIISVINTTSDLVYSKFHFSNVSIGGMALLAGTGNAYISMNWNNLTTTEHAATLALINLSTGDVLKQLLLSHYNTSGPIQGELGGTPIVAPSGNIYVLDTFDCNINVVNGTAFSFVAQIHIQPCPYVLVPSPSGALYATDGQSNGVVFAISTIANNITSAIPIGNATYPSSISIDPSGKFAYVGIGGYAQAGAVEVMNLTSGMAIGNFSTVGIASGIIVR